MAECHQCGVKMLGVGREIKPGHPEIYVDAFVCPTRGCSGYAVKYHDGSESHWPALTLMDAGIFSCIRGAIKFKKAVIG